MTDPTPRVVTALEPDPRKPGVVRVHADGRPYCAVPAEALARAGVGLGSPLTPDRLNLLGGLADEEGAYRTLLRALERRPFAKADLGRRLARKGHRPEAVEAALERAAQAGLLDDAAFARGFVETRALRGRGPGRLTRDLQALGVDRRQHRRRPGRAVARGHRPPGHAPRPGPAGPPGWPASPGGQAPPPRGLPGPARIHRRRGAPGHPGGTRRFLVMPPGVGGIFPRCSPPVFDSASSTSSRPRGTVTCPRPRSSPPTTRRCSSPTPG